MKTEAARLHDRRKMSKVSRRLRPRLAVFIKTLETEQTPAMREKATRLFCRALIRLNLQDNGEADHGKSLGIL